MSHDDFTPALLRTHGDYLELLQRLRPSTTAVEFTFPDGDDGHALAGLLADFEPERVVGVGVRPGYARPNPRAVVLRCRYRRELFAVLAQQEGFFRYHELPRGDRVEPTVFGIVDVTFLDARGQVLCYTVTHEGLAFVRA